MECEAGTEIPYHVCRKDEGLAWASSLKIHGGSQNLKPSPPNAVIISGQFTGHMINIYWTSNPTGTARAFQEELQGYHRRNNI